MVRVLTIDDHAPFLKAAHDLVTVTPGFDSAGEETSAKLGMTRIVREAPDLVLVDVHMPEVSGIEVARKLQESANPPVVVLISAVDPSNLPAAALACGAAAVISKHELGPSLLRELWATHGPSGSEPERH